jgi:hypothetical protein
MAEENTKKSRTMTANDSFYKSLTHTRPDPTTKAPALRRGSQSNGGSVSSNTSRTPAKKP